MNLSEKCSGNDVNRSLKVKSLFGVTSQDLETTKMWQNKTSVLCFVSEHSLVNAIFLNIVNTFCS